MSNYGVAVETNETLDTKIRALGTLEQRIEMAQERIGEMCRDSRPPKMTIPVQATDDDLFITTALMDAANEIAQLRTELAAANAELARILEMCAELVKVKREYMSTDMVDGKALASLCAFVELIDQTTVLPNLSAQAEGES